MSTILVNVVTAQGTVQPIVVNTDRCDHDALPEPAILHFLGYDHEVSDCQHPECTATIKGTPRPNGEDVAVWRGQHPDTMWLVGWYARVYADTRTAEPGDPFRSGWLMAAAWMAAHS